MRDNFEGIVTEFLGMFLIVLVTCLAEMNKEPKEPSNPGICLFLMYAFLSYSNLRFSQAHLNPAVTLAYFLSGDATLVTLISYWIAQFGASFLAGFVLLFFRGGFTGGTLGMPWVSKFVDTGSYVVHPIQGTPRLTSLQHRAVQLLLPHVHPHEEPLRRAESEERLRLHHRRLLRCH